jgi:hypothetical protein
LRVPFLASLVVFVIAMGRSRAASGYDN